MKILVIGKNGQLGKSIQKLCIKSKQSKKFTFVGRDEIDLSKIMSISNYFRNKKFDIIINCAAYTNVDKAEQEKEISNRINNLAVSELAKIAHARCMKLIHISTDYVFDGKIQNSYKETDIANPINVYGMTKLLGEKRIQEYMPNNGIIIRTSWLYSEHGNNFVKKILQQGINKKEVSVVNDQIGSPTYANDLALVILQILNQENYLSSNEITKIYHFANLGRVSWYEFAKEIFKTKNISCKIKPISSLEYSSTADRPKNSSLDSYNIMKKLNLKGSKWNISLKKYLNLDTN